MDRLEAMQIFVGVAEKRSFSAEAEARGISRPRVSRAVAALEDMVGAQLLVRTTRRVSLSTVGARYLEDCKRILDALDDANATARGDHSTPTGELVITAPVLFGRLHVLPVLVSFLADYPQVRARVVLLDRVTNLVAEGIDVAVRIGRLPDSSLRAVRVGEVGRVCVASPAYLEQRGCPTSPEHLAEHTLVAHSTRTRWDFRDTKLLPNPTLWVNDSWTAVDAAVRGLGITQVLSYQSGPAVAEGRLTRVLPDHAIDPVPVHLVVPEGRTPARARLFIDHAKQRLRETARAGWALRPA